MKLKTAIQMYKEHLRNRQISDKTLSDYTYWLRKLNELFGDKSMGKLSRSEVVDSMRQYLSSGKSRMAYQIHNAGQKVYKYLAENGYKGSNPFQYPLVKYKPRDMMWTYSELDTFLNRAYSQFRTRNVGLIVQMLYETKLTITEALHLKWKDVELDSVGGPEIMGNSISHDFRDMLVEQENDFGFQDYVVPMTQSVNGKYVPYKPDYFATVVTEILDKAGLDTNLRAADLMYKGVQE